MKYVGYWRSGLVSNLPDPRSHIDDSWDTRERDAVVAHLQNSPVSELYFGSSTCRMCQKANGSAEHSDGVYTWPEGYAHYLIEHHVKPPSGFLEHLRRKGVLR